MEYTIDTSTQKTLDWSATGNDRILQNVLNLITTWRYEVAYDRTKGLNPDILDKPAEEANALYISEIYRLVETYEPNAAIKDIQLLSINPDGEIEVRVVVEI